MVIGRKFIEFFFILLFALSLFSPTTYGWMDMPWVTFFYISASLSLIVFVYFVFKLNKQFILNRADCCVALYLIYIILLQVCHGQKAIQNEQFLTVFILVLLYGMCRHSIDKKPMFLFRSIAAVSLFINIYSFRQLVYCLNNHLPPLENVNFLFFNSGIMAILLSILFPVHIFLIRHDKRIIKLISIINVLLSILLISAVQSRTAILICLLPLLIFAYARIKNKAVSFIPISIIITSLFFYKLNSSSGRLLIWNISLSHAFEHIAGIGLGNFSYQYPLWQAEYFSKNLGDHKGIYLAGMSFYAFNEWVQLLIEGGLFSVIFFVGFILFTLKNSIKNFQSNELHVFTLIVIGVCIATLFSYPLHNPSVFFILILSCAYINTYSGNYTSKIILPITFNKLFGIIGIVTGVILSGYFISQYIALGWWRDAKQNIITNEPEALKYYKKAYPLLQHKGEFLFNYGAQCYEIGMYDKSLTLFNKAENIFSHYNLFIYTGLNYQAISQFNKAEHYFTIAENMLPSRLYPKSLLAKLYCQTGDSTKAFIKANEIILFKNKVENPIDDSIKNEMKILLQYEK